MAREMAGDVKARQFLHRRIGRRTWAAAGLTWLASVLLAGPSGSAGWLAGGLVTAGCLCWGLDMFDAVVLEVGDADSRVLRHRLENGRINFPMYVGHAHIGPLADLTCPLPSPDGSSCRWQVGRDASQRQDDGALVHNLFDIPASTWSGRVRLRARTKISHLHLFLTPPAK